MEAKDWGLGFWGAESLKAVIPVLQTQQPSSLFFHTLLLDLSMSGKILLHCVLVLNGP